jgi:RNA polymerase sigma-70 factor, ECF subfamily
MTFAIRQTSLSPVAVRALREREMEIITAAQAGSAAAFDELQRLYAPRLFRTVLRITRNREDAEDALQDTFLRAYVALRYFEARSSVYAWLTRIAINSALMILRKQRGRHEVLFVPPFGDLDHDPQFEVADSALNPEQWCDLCQRNDLMLLAIAKLEPTLRIPIEVHLAGEHSIKEIADTLNISVPAVKARLHRARIHVAKRISKRIGAKEHGNSA